MTPNIAIVHVQNPHWRGIRLVGSAVSVVDSAGAVVTADFSGCAGRMPGRPNQPLARYRGLLGHFVQPAGDRCPRMRGREPGYGSHLVRLTMNNERRAILSLIAMGRITPREAERLLACWPDSSETAWVVGACAVIAAGMGLAHVHEMAHAHQLLERFTDFFKTNIADGWRRATSQTLSFLTRIAGGAL